MPTQRQAPGATVVEDVLTRAKDHAFTGTILAIAGIAWFGWAHVGERLTTALGLGMIAGVAVVVWGVILIRVLPGTTRMATDPAARRAYWSAMGAQAIAILVGVVWLGGGENSDYVPAWVLAAVGAHFLPLAKAFGTRILGLAGWACVGVAALATGSGLVDWLPVHTVAGGGGGLVLLVSAVLALREAGRE